MDGWAGNGIVLQKPLMATKAAKAAKSARAAITAKTWAGMPLEATVEQCSSLPMYDSATDNKHFYVS